MIIYVFVECCEPVTRVLTADLRNALINDKAAIAWNCVPKFNQFARKLQWICRTNLTHCQKLLTKCHEGARQLCTVTDSERMQVLTMVRLLNDQSIGLPPTV